MLAITPGGEMVSIRLPAAAEPAVRSTLRKAVQGDPRQVPGSEYWQCIPSRPEIPASANVDPPRNVRPLTGGQSLPAKAEAAEAGGSIRTMKRSMENSRGKELNLFFLYPEAA
jgi:hypothetical protein